MNHEFTDAQVKQLQQMFADGLAPIQRQLKDGEGRMDHLAADIVDLTEKQAVNNKKTDEMFAMFETASKGIKFLGQIGAGIKWAAGIAASVATAYTLWKSHKP